MAINAIKEMAVVDKVPFYTWDDVEGFVHFFTEQNYAAQDDIQSEKINPPLESQFLTALKVIYGIGVDKGKKLTEEGYIVLNNPTPYFKVPSVITLLKKYAYQLPTTNIRIVIVAPESFSLPEELSHDIFVTDYGLPTKNELHSAFLSVQGSYEIQMTEATGKAMKPFKKDGMDAILSVASGMTILEAETAFSQAFWRNTSDSCGSIELGDFTKVVQEAKTDIVKRSEVLEVEKSLSVESVQGMEVLKEWVHLHVKAFSEEAKLAKVDRPKGVALIGPPGCLAKGTDLLIRRGKRNSGRHYTIKQLHDRFHGHKGKWDRKIKSYMHSRDMETGVVFYNEIKDVIFAGQKECLEVTMSDGSAVVGAYNHPVLLDNNTFVRLIELKVGDKVCARASMLPTKLPTKKQKSERIVIDSLKHYTHGWTHEVNGYSYGRQNRARLVIEAHMNKISLGKYLFILRNNPDKASSLLFLNAKYDVHHINHNALDDRLSNLMVMERDEHKRHHQHYGSHKFNIDYTKTVEVVRVRPVGVRTCYDITMAMPSDNFALGNGIIVHNTGKSICSKAIASMLNLPLVRVDIGRLYGSYVGQTEARTRVMFKELEAMAPCVVWVDEIDKAGLSSGSSGDSGVTSRLLGSLLTHMSENEAGLFWVFTANRVKTLPSELSRKGRLDEVFSVLPPTAIERKQILEYHLGKRGIDVRNLDLSKIVAESKDYVGAELEAVCKEAKVESFAKEVPLDEEMLLRHLKNMRSLSEAYPEQFEEMKDWAEKNARPSSLQVEDTNVVMEGRSSPRIRRR